MTSNSPTAHPSALKQNNDTRRRESAYKETKRRRVRLWQQHVNARSYTAFEAIEQRSKEWFTENLIKQRTMKQADYIRLTAQIAVLKEIAVDYSDKTIGNIIQQLEAIKKEAKND
jgi:hypothetical protein